MGSISHNPIAREAILVLVVFSHLWRFVCSPFSPSGKDGGMPRARFDGPNLSLTKPVPFEFSRFPYGAALSKKTALGSNSTLAPKSCRFSTAANNYVYERLPRQFISL
jgi:hypothetical protein